MHATISKICAVVLVVLIMLPFTAPFSTCDLAVVSPVHQDSDSMSAAKTSNQTTAIPFLAASPVLVSNVTFVPTSDVAAVPDRREAHSVVLRL